MDHQFIAALDGATGDVAWQTSRSGKMDETPELRKAYGTPLIISVEGRALVISPAANRVYAYDADTGSEAWKASYGQLGFSTVPRPVASGDTVYVATSYKQSRSDIAHCGPALALLSGPTLQQLNYAA